MMVSRVHPCGWFRSNSLLVQYTDRNHYFRPSVIPMTPLRHSVVMHFDRALYQTMFLPGTSYVLCLVHVGIGQMRSLKGCLWFVRKKLRAWSTTALLIVLWIWLLAIGANIVITLPCLQRWYIDSFTWTMIKVLAVPLSMYSHLWLLMRSMSFLFDSERKQTAIQIRQADLTRWTARNTHHQLMRIVRWTANMEPSKHGP